MRGEVRHQRRSQRLGRHHANDGFDPRRHRHADGHHRNARSIRAETGVSGWEKLFALLNNELLLLILNH